MLLHTLLLLLHTKTDVLKVVHCQRDSIVENQTSVIVRWWESSWQGGGVGGWGLGKQVKDKKGGKSPLYMEYRLKACLVAGMSLMAVLFLAMVPIV